MYKQSELKSYIKKIKGKGVGGGGGGRVLELVIFFTMNPESKFKILFLRGGGGGMKGGRGLE